MGFQLEVDCIAAAEGDQRSLKGRVEFLRDAPRKKGVGPEKVRPCPLAAPDRERILLGTGSASKSGAKLVWSGARQDTGSWIDPRSFVAFLHG
jgi:hypothetical protein